MSPLPGRVLAIDFGDVRIGLAMSDAGGILASPLKVITYKGTLKRAAHVIKEELPRLNTPEKIIVGMPYSMDGSKGEKAQQVQEFVDYLKTLVELPIETWDERLSSVEAERNMALAGMRQKEMRGKVDMVAAAIFLQNYLDSERRQAQEEEL